MSRSWVSVEVIGMVALMAAISLAKIDSHAEEAPALSAAPSPSEGSRRGDLTPDTIVYTKEQADQVFFRKGEADLSGYATEQWVEDKGYLTDHQSLAGYATEQWVEDKGYLTAHQSLAGYATEQWVEGKGYLTDHQSLEGYLTKEDIVRLVSATIRSVVCVVYLTKEADGTVSVRERSDADIESLVEEVLSEVMTESNTGGKTNTQGVVTSVSGEDHGSR